MGRTSSNVLLRPRFTSPPKGKTGWAKGSTTACAQSAHTHPFFNPTTAAAGSAEDEPPAKRPWQELLST